MHISYCPLLNDIVIEKDVMSGLRGLQLQRDHARDFLSVIVMTLIAMHKCIKEGELVLKWISQNRQDPCGKWSPNWEGPYVLKKAFSGGALILTEMDGKSSPVPSMLI